MSGDAELVELFGAVLDLCKVVAGEVVAVLSEDGERQAYATAYLLAARKRGAQALQVNVAKQSAPPGTLTKFTSLTGNQAAVDVLKTADLVIDLVGLLWSAEQKELQDSGTRILMSREPVEIIRRMFPTARLRERVEAAEKLLAAAKSLRVTSPSGTDVTYRLGTYPVVTQYGFTDQPGRWDNLAAGGFLYTGGADDGVDGVVVIGAGDMIFPFKRYVAAPIRLNIKKGHVVGIEGTNLDTELLRNYIQQYNDPRAYAISHIGWGMDDKARWDFLGTDPIAQLSSGVDGRSFCGNVLFSTGPNLELGGSNDTGCHLDIPLRGCDLFLDGKPIVKAGTIVPAELAP